VFLDPGVDVRISKMQQVVLQMRGRAFQDNMLVHFVIAGAGVVGVECFITAEFVAEQAEVPTGVVAAMFDPAAKEHEPAVNEIAVGAGFEECRANFVGQLGRDAFVGIEDKDPFVFPGDIFERPVFLFRETAVLMEV